MTTLDRGWVIVGLLFLTLTGIAMGLAGLEPSFDSWMAGILIVVVEIVVYFLVAMATNPKATVGMAAGTAIIYAFIRFVCSILGAFLYGLYPSQTDPSPLLTWLSFIPALIQIFVLLAAGPYMLAYSIPELLGRKESAALRGSDAVDDVPRPTALEASPTGGFVQVFSYEELTGTIKKSHGLEGFVIYSTEGFVVWRDLPMRLDTDKLVARLMNHCGALGGLLHDSGLTRVRRVIIESRDHTLFNTTLNQNFGLLLVFNSRVTQEEIHSRLAILTKSTREFLQWKYPSLPLMTGLSRDQIPLEGVQ